MTTGRPACLPFAVTLVIANWTVGVPVNGNINAGDCGHEFLLRTSRVRIIQSTAILHQSVDNMGQIIASKPGVSVDPHVDVRYCARLLDRFGLAVVPEIENEQVMGIVSYSELVFRGLRNACTD